MTHSYQCCPGSPQSKSEKVQFDRGHSFGCGRWPVHAGQAGPSRVLLSGRAGSVWPCGPGIGKKAWACTPFSDQVDPYEGGGQGLEVGLLGEFHLTGVASRRDTPCQTSLLRAVDNLVLVYKINPCDRILVEVPDHSEVLKRLLWKHPLKGKEEREMEAFIISLLNDGAM
jgi:hypothetical protein